MAGCECVSHVMQALTEADLETTIVSFDGESTFDLISREAMLNRLLHVDGEGAMLLFARLFYGRGTTHIVHHLEGGGQRDPLMS